MRNRKDLSILSSIIRRVRGNPREDLDDALFYAICRSVWLDKEIAVSESVVEDHGKRYLKASLDECNGKTVPIRRMLLDFLDAYVMLDGFVLDGLIIEKGFVEELISAIDSSTMTAIAEDISSYESEAAAAADESLPSFPDIRKWNSEAVLTIPRVAYGDGERAKERLARQYRAVLSKAAEAGYRTLSIAPLSDYPLDLEGEIAASSVNAFFAFNPSSPMSVTFVLPDESSLARFLSSDHEEEG